MDDDNNRHAEKKRNKWLDNLFLIQFPLHFHVGGGEIKIEK